MRKEPKKWNEIPELDVLDNCPFHQHAILR